jgi:hypothetical protein
MSNNGINYIDVLADLRGRREKLDIAIAAIEEIVDSAPKRETAPVLPPRAITSPGTVIGLSVPAVGPYSGMTVIGAAMSFLRNAGSPRDTKAIVKGLLSGGFHTNSKSFYRTLYNTLNSNLDKEITRNKNGAWGLKEWGEN